MIFIKDICEYFLEECKTAYIDYYTGMVCFSPNEYTIEIPKAFKRIDLLREYIEANESKSFIRIVQP